MLYAMQSNLKILKDRRDDVCVDLVKRMSKREHKPHHLLPKTVSKTRERETRARYYNYMLVEQRLKRLCHKYILTLSNS